MSLISNCFTFQYVSINTCCCSKSAEFCSNFTFQYVSINTIMMLPSLTVNSSLHSNMFLLIHEKTCTLGWAQNYFTFQYVSINT